ADTGLVTSLNNASNGVKDRRVGLVKQLRADLRIPINAEHKLRQVVAADGDTLDAHFRVSGNPVRDGRNLGHHPDRKTGSTGMRLDEIEAALQLPRRTDERDHEAKV